MGRVSPVASAVREASAGQADDVRSRVHAALRDLQSGPSASPVADGMQYEITVDDGGATNRYAAADGSMAPAVR